MLLSKQMQLRIVDIPLFALEYITTPYMVPFKIDLLEPAVPTISHQHIYSQQTPFPHLKP